MTINFDDVTQMMHGGQRIPIDTLDAFAATRQAAMAIYSAEPVKLWDEDADQQLEQRVRNGMTVAAIIAETLKDRRARFDE